MPHSAIQLRILEATLACVSEEGLRSSTDLICRLAGVSAGTLFRHYASKEVLLRTAFAYAEQLLFQPRENLPGETVYDQLHRLWFRTAAQALAHRDAFTYWRLYRLTPADRGWSFPNELRLGTFEVVSLIVHRRTGTLPEHSQQGNLLDAWQWTAQWTAAVQLAIFMVPMADTPGWPTQMHPTPTQVLTLAFEAAWRSLGLSRQLGAEQSAYA